ncbi:respiratory nitrate reductase subunit gamma [Amycolatopsis sp. CA-230715]|uniref:respiratory nitrate reductase subunit gamma n=1 Tax=Amycolatopsis sp. CA-230715 TaxID=2745196 RepID=UPI001C022C80|nr:respiratory nitrate reductase subunit gamma [Amycolatopsis sp. CA-230715]QWF83971.1 Nitrate reductase-like protein NarX [Amycolatopsis sp. CA-230715]
MNLLLWGAAPYVTIALLVAGTIWRYRHDKFGWTSRSSQLHESKLLKVASPVFHFGLLMVVGGHVLGLLVPEGMTEFFGIDEETYHVVSLAAGTVAGFAAIGGLALLLWRRLRTPAVRQSTSRSDRYMYLVLALALIAGLATTLIDNGFRGPYDYRLTVGPWFRGILLLHPQPSLMANAPIDYQLHTGLGMLLFALWPFSRLVHAFSAPIQYLTRPYVVYRSRERERVGTRTPRRGWE